MNGTQTPAKEAEMARTFEYRLNYDDGTYEIVAVVADDLLVAGVEVDRIAALRGARSRRLLGSIDRAPQRALAF